MLDKIKKILGSKSEYVEKDADDLKIQSKDHPRINELLKLADSFGGDITVCPHCACALLKHPKRKTKCKECETYIYPRINQITGEAVLLVQDELDLHEEMQAYKQGSWESWFDFRQKLIKSKKEVASSLGMSDWEKVSDNDANWYRLTEERIYFASNLDWREYAESTFMMLPILASEHKSDKEYDLKSEYIFLSYNCAAASRVDLGQRRLFQSMSLAQLSVLYNRNVDLHKLHNHYKESLVFKEWGINFIYSANQCWSFFLKDVEQNKSFLNRR